MRAVSYNTAVVQALASLSPKNINIDVFEGLGALPLFNPDIEFDYHSVVDQLKLAVEKADGLIIASPEYAHGISGVMKNALDWLLSGEGFIDIPVMLVNTSPRASHAQAALREVVETMSGKIIEGAYFCLPLLGSDLDAKGIENHAAFSASLLAGLAKFRKGILEE